MKKVKEQAKYHSTIGLLAAGHGQNCLVMFESKVVNDTVMVQAVSGHTLEKIRQSPMIVITKAQFNDRDSNPYDDVVEWRWFAALCGWHLSCGDPKHDGYWSLADDADYQ